MRGGASSVFISPVREELRAPSGRAGATGREQSIAHSGMQVLHSNQARRLFFQAMMASRNGLA